MIKHVSNSKLTYKTYMPYWQFENKTGVNFKNKWPYDLQKVNCSATLFF